MHSRPGRTDGRHEHRTRRARPAVRAAVELVAAGAVLPAPLAEAAMDELMDGTAPATQVAALLAMLRVRGETPEELAAFARVMRARAVAVDGSRWRRRPVRDRGGRRGHLQHLDPRRVRRRRRRRAGRQARQPGDHQPLRLGGRDRGARDRARPGAGGGRAPHRRDRLRIHLRALVSPGHEARHADPAGAAHPHLLQPARADQLAGRRPPPAARRRGGAAAAADGGSAGPPRHRSRPRRPLVGDGLDELSLAGPNRAMLVEGRMVGEVEIDPRSSGCGARRASASRAVTRSSTAPLR